MNLDTHQAGFPWLELLIALLVVSLIFQIWPALWWGLLWAVDVRNWSWSVIIGANVVVVLGLLYLKSFRDS
jgi:hypothetical protein